MSLESLRQPFLIVNFICPVCNGSGRVELTQPGTMPTPAPCGHCQGGIASTPISVTEFAKALLPILFPPVETPPANGAPILLAAEEAQPNSPADVAATAEMDVVVPTEAAS